MKKNEHPGCSCRACRRGRRTQSGQFVVKQINKRIRRGYRQALRAGMDVVQIIVSTPYTD